MHSFDRMSTSFVQAALRDAGVIEHRALLGSRAVSRHCRSIDELRAAVAAAPEANHYATLNRPHPGDYGRRALADDDIAIITRLPFDFDPERPKGSNATDAELRAAEEVKNRFVAFMVAIGFPPPAQAMSGNGYHAVFRCRLDSTPELREMLAGIYRGLATHFSTPEVRFDTTVRNPSRILRLYGTLNRKAPATADRPQRISTVWVPEQWRAFQMRHLEALAATVAPPPKASTSRKGSFAASGKGDFKTLDIVAWMRSHGLYKRRVAPGKHAVTCPWLDEHSDGDHPLRTDTVVWEADGNWPTFYCSHDHCDGRGIREVIARLGNADPFCGRHYA